MIPKISIIIPVYNVRRYLKECLDSIVNQTLKDIEIICIDDGSTDNSWELLSNYSETDSRIKILKKENEGVAKTRNLGLTISTGEYIAFMDPDDLYPTNDVLETLYYKAIENNVLICGGNFSTFINENKELNTDFEDEYSGYTFEKDSLISYEDYQFDYGYTRFIYNREFLLKNALFFPNYKRFQDPPFFVKAMLTAKRFYGINKLTYAYRCEQNHFSWDKTKALDCLCGIADNLSFSKKYKLKKLESYTKKRLANHYSIFKHDISILTLLGFMLKDIIFIKYFCKKLLNNIFSTRNSDDRKNKLVTVLGFHLIFRRKTMSKINIGVIGCGVIGGALIDWISKNNPSINILKVDPPKGYNDDLSKADVIFISIHIPTETDGSQNIEILEQIVSECPNVPIFIRTTLLPGTCKLLSEKYNRDVNFMPEFLTERTAVSDFARQPIIFSNHAELLKKIFVGKEYIEMTTLEAEITKYAHNVFGALKVTYFNGINELCDKLGADYSKIQKGCLLSGYINKPHTDVPGPDGKLGYGGKCFPKDVNAFIDYLEGTELQKLISLLPEINEKYREANNKELINA